MNNELFEYGIGSVTQNVRFDNFYVVLHFKLFYRHSNILTVM